MNENSFVKKHKKLFLFLAVVVVAVGGIGMFSLNEKNKADQRNREYKVSLVDTLKNTYKGIKEIKITDSDYTMPPGSWSCDVEILFDDRKTLKYGIGYSIENKRMTDASLEWENRTQDRQFLNDHKGKTETIVKVTYSDNTKGEL